MDLKKHSRVQHLFTKQNGEVKHVNKTQILTIKWDDENFVEKVYPEDVEQLNEFDDISVPTRQEFKAAINLNNEVWEEEKTKPY